MILFKNPLAFKKFLFWVFLVFAGLLSLSISLISLISVWIGIQHWHHSGSWVPISGGIALFAFVSFIYFRTVRSFHYHIKKDAVFEI